MRFRISRVVTFFVVAVTTIIIVSISGIVPNEHGSGRSMWTDQEHLKDAQVTVTVTATVTAAAGSSTGISLAKLHPDHCENPYLHPGYIWYNSSVEEIDTSWIPFYSGMLDMAAASLFDAQGRSVDPVMNGEPYYPKTPPPKELRDTAPHGWMQDIMKHHELRQKINAGEDIDQDEYLSLQSQLEWLRNRRILIVSDSVDRYQSEYVCNRVGEEMQIAPEGIQTTTWCHIPEFNFTFTNWHVASMSTTRPKWWWLKNMKVIPIEQRWKQYYLPHVNETIGTNGHSPDLVLFQTGLWDYTFFSYAPQTANGEVDFHRSLNWTELRFFMQRVKFVLGALRKQFGYDMPILCRAVTYKKDLLANAAVHDLDRASRFVCSELGLETMEYGQLNDGFFNFYKDLVHIDRGPTSVLWANMFFWYLFRSRGGIEYRGQIIKEAELGQVNASEKWNRCHDMFMGQQYPSKY